MMKYRLVRLMCALALSFFVNTVASAQAVHQLTLDDFQGTPRQNGATVAYTNCSIRFTYKARREKNYYLLDFDIGVNVNVDKSWIDVRRIKSDDMLAEVLNHEQGHYIIAYMEQQELLRTVSRTVFYEGYQEQARAIFDRIDAKYKQLNHDYDADTQHMLNHEQQQSWDAYFKKRLEYMPPVNG